jgi:hypothetical protein
VDVIDQILEYPVFITSVSFTESQIEIQFLEHIDQKEGVSMMRSMGISLGENQQVQRAFMDLQEILRDLVDEGYFQLRNSGGSTVRERMLQKRREAGATHAE